MKKTLDTSHFAYVCAEQPSSIFGQDESKVGNCAACCKSVFNVETKEEFYVAAQFQRCVMLTQGLDYLLGFVRLIEARGPCHFRLNSQPTPARLHALRRFYPALFDSTEKMEKMLSGVGIALDLDITVRINPESLEADLKRYGPELSASYFATDEETRD